MRYGHAQPDEPVDCGQEIACIYAPGPGAEIRGGEAERVDNRAGEYARSSLDAKSLLAVESWKEDELLFRSGVATILRWYRKDTRPDRWLILVKVVGDRAAAVEQEKLLHGWGILHRPEKQINVDRAFEIPSGFAKVAQQKRCLLP